MILYTSIIVTIISIVLLILNAGIIYHAPYNGDWLRNYTDEQPITRMVKGNLHHYIIHLSWRSLLKRDKQIPMISYFDDCIDPQCRGENDPLQSSTDTAWYIIIPLFFRNWSLCFTYVMIKQNACCKTQKHHSFFMIESQVFTNIPLKNHHSPHFSMVKSARIHQSFHAVSPMAHRPSPVPCLLLQFFQFPALVHDLRPW